jgi:hypothetical protein
VAWLDYFDARRLLVHEWSGHGVSAEDIAVRLEVEPAQVESILLQSTEPLPGCSRARAMGLREQVLALQREVHAYRETPTLRPPPAVSDIRGLLSNPDPALCGCQYWVPSDGVTLDDDHQAGCLFAANPKP